MTQKIIISLLISLFFSNSLLSQNSSTGTLEIKFTDLRTDKGQIAIGINSSPEGWPRKAEIELNWKKENVKDGVFIVRAANLPLGTLAVSVLDDENSNLEMDMTLGFPREGFGFSRDAPIRMSPPKFEDCSFDFSRSGQQITIRMRYMGKGK